MRRLVVGLSVVAVLGMASPVAGEAIRVGVVYGGTATGSELAAQLNGDTFFDFTATPISAGAADSLAELSAYDVVVLGDSGSALPENGYTAAMFSAIRSFMDGGGGVVTVGWYNHATDDYSGQQALDADYITPIADGEYNSQLYFMGDTVDVAPTVHPITTGISDYSFSGLFIEYETGVDANATKLGSLVSEPSAVTIAFQDTNGRSVYLGGLYLAEEDTYNNAGLRTGVEDRLLEQAVAWAGAGSTANPVPEPSTLMGLVSMGLMGALGYSWRRRRRAA